MKSIVMPKMVQLDEETKKQLPQEVKETLAKEASVTNKPRFTAIDMWNRQRQSRSASARMNKWNLN